MFTESYQIRARTGKFIFIEFTRVHTVCSILKILSAINSVK